jgi:Rab GDP dissociation inhibitor
MFSVMKYADVRLCLGMNLRTTTARQFFDYFGLDASSIDFAGHAMALQSEESYLDRPAAETVEGIKLYAQSLERYGRSPFLYPEYGLGGLPEAFSRCVCVYVCARARLQCVLTCCLSQAVCYSQRHVHAER